MMIGAMAEMTINNHRLRNSRHRLTGSEAVSLTFISAESGGHQGRIRGQGSRRCHSHAITVMHILLIGSGGREHALAWKLAASAKVTKVTVAPGNPGMLAEDGVETVDIAVTDLSALERFAHVNAVDMTIVGPEAPLVAGLVNRFNDAQLPILGPTKDAAQLEGSKNFAKEFMQRHHIPTAAFATFNSSADALAYLEDHPAPIVIKADGLAAGKGVVVAQTSTEAQQAVREMLDHGAHGDAGARVVIEEFLSGEEASFICLVDGETALPFATSQDHKARNERDTGPNTGGMGAYSPAPVVTASVHEKIMQRIVEPTVAGLANDGVPFKGFLYVGLMIDAAGDPRVIEFNVRLGDPETQPLLMRLDSDLFELCEAAVSGDLNKASAEWSTDKALGIVMAAGDYPASGSRGEIIEGIDEAQATGAKVFHAGTSIDEQNNTVTAGGRVLCVTARAATIAKAKSLAEAAAANIDWPNVHWRRDIGHRAIKREQDATSATESI